MTINKQDILVGDGARFYGNLTELIDRHDGPVLILLEGRREVPEAVQPCLTSLGERLAREFPRVMFRSRNVTGADALFAAGVASVDLSRLELVIPYESMAGRNWGAKVVRGCFG